MKTKSPLHEAITASMSHGRVPVADLVQNPNFAAVASKVVGGRYPASYDGSGNRNAELPNVVKMRETAQRVSSNIIDNQTTLQLLPDMELAAQILISSILSPKDLVTTEITYMAPDGLLPPAVAAALCARMKQYYETDYKIKDILPKILKDALFETGSYPVAVIPENSLDEIINGVRKITTESFGSLLIGTDNKTFAPLGVLGPVKTKGPQIHKLYATVSLEDYSPKEIIDSYDSRVTLESEFNRGVETYISVIDNPSLLKLPMVSEKVRSLRVSSLCGMRSLESEVIDGASKITDQNVALALTRGRTYSYQPMVQVLPQDQLNRKSIGSPLVLHLPTESVIPVFVPGRPEKHLGYFVLIDEEGNPVAHAEETDYYTQMSNRLQNGTNFASNMMQKVKANMIGFDVGDRDHLDYAARVYGSMIEKDLLQRLRNGVYGSGVTIAQRDEIYRVMLSRTLAQKSTQILYIPAEMMTYFAFKYTKQGIGKTLLDDLKIVNSLRTMVMFANVMSAIKNSIGRTEVKVKLDEEDPDPQRAIEKIMHEILRSRQQGFPVGCSNPADVVDYLGRAAFEFTFEGHPGLPDVSIDFGEKASNFTKPDTDLDEMLKKQAIMGVGLSPENIDAAYQSELATSVVANNLLLSKRVTMYQDQLTPMLSDHIRKVTVSCSTLMGDLEQILSDNKEKLIARIKKQEGDKYKNVPDELVIKQLLNDFVSCFEVGLPKPSSVTLEAQLTAMKVYEDGLDSAINHYISTDFMNQDTAGDISAYIDSLKAIIKAHYMRKYMAENGIMPELFELVTADEDGQPAIDVYSAQADHVGAITKSLAQFMAHIAKVRDAANIVEAERKEEDSAAGAGASPTTSEPSSSDEPASDDSMTGDDSLNLDMPDLDVGGGNTPEDSPTEAPTDETQEPPAE